MEQGSHDGQPIQAMFGRQAGRQAAAGEGTARLPPLDLQACYAAGAMIAKSGRKRVPSGRKRRRRVQVDAAGHVSNACRRSVDGVGLARLGWAAVRFAI